MMSLLRMSRGPCRQLACSASSLCSTGTTTGKSTQRSQTWVYADIARLRIGSSANFLTTMLTGNGVPNDVISNFNSLSIIVLGPCLNVSHSFLKCKADVVTDMRNCSMACTLHSARPESTTVLLLALPLASSSALSLVSDTAFFATRHTRPTPVAGTEALTPCAWTRVSSHPSRSGGLPFHSLWVDSPSYSSTYQVCHHNALVCITRQQH